MLTFIGSRIDLFEQLYEDMCYDALENFCNTYWPCNFSNGKHKCRNVKSGHSPKGHQNSAGKIIAAGSYQSDFEASEYEYVWLDAIRSRLQDIQQQVHERSFHQSLPELEAAWKVHQEVMTQFYGDLDDVSSVVSHTTCFSCLREFPEHSLPCGHVLCTPCVTACGQYKQKTLELRYCPLHISDQWDSPWEVRIKPVHAGTRILSLDG